MTVHEFKQDLEALLEEYDDLGDDELRTAAYQVIDYYGEDNLAREWSGC